MKLNLYKQLNVFYALSELYSFTVNTNISDRIKDTQKLVKLRAKEENASEIDIQRKNFKEVNIARVSGFLFSIAMMILTVFLGMKNLTVIACVIACLSPALVISSMFLRKGVVQKFYERGVTLDTY